MWRACHGGGYGGGYGSGLGACAYATLVLNDRFGGYAYALHRSLRAAGASAPLVVLATEDVSEEVIATLVRLGGEGSGVDGEGGRSGGNSSSGSSGSGSGGSSGSGSSSGSSSRSGEGGITLAAPATGGGDEAHGCPIRIRRIGRLTYPSRYRATSEDGETRKSLRFTKLEAWRLIEYRKVVLIDTDTLVLKPIDSLFTCPAGSAVADMGAPGNFNSGVFVLQPSEAVYEELRRLTPLLISYNQGDQVCVANAHQMGTRWGLTASCLPACACACTCLPVLRPHLPSLCPACTCLPIPHLPSLSLK